MRGEWMRVKVTFISFPMDIQESNPKLLLELLGSAAYYGSVFPATYRLHIKEMGFAFRREGYKIHWPLFDEGLVDIAASPN